MRAFVVSILSLAGVAEAECGEFVFRDVGDEAGLFPHVAGIQGHGAGWGDVDGDGWLDLYVGTFPKAGAKPNLFFRNEQGKFRLDEQGTLRLSARATGVVFADLDNDGDLDLYVGSMPQPKNGLAAARSSATTARASSPTSRRTTAPARRVRRPQRHGARLRRRRPARPARRRRSAPRLQRLDDEKLAAVSAIWASCSSRTCRATVGLPADTPGLGVAAADVNNDGWPDFFLASQRGGNVLFLNDGKGKFREVPGSRKTFAWKGAKGATT